MEAVQDVSVEKGRYGNREITLLQNIGIPRLHSVIEEEEQKTSTAVFVYVPEMWLDQYLKTLLERSFKFHRTDVKNGSTCYAYYRWIGKDADRVPDASSSIEGVSAMLLSPDKKMILFVKEHHTRWKLVSGAVNRAETAWDCAEREVKEEVGLSCLQSTYLFALNQSGKDSVPRRLEQEEIEIWRHQRSFHVFGDACKDMGLQNRQRRGINSFPISDEFFEFFRAHVGDVIHDALFSTNGVESSDQRC